MCVCVALSFPVGGSLRSLFKKGGKKRTEKEKEGKKGDCMACWDSGALFVTEAGSGCKSGHNMTSALRERERERERHTLSIFSITAATYTHKYSSNITNIIA